MDSLPRITRCEFFIFKCYGDLRDLHSFPTRRSSDLTQFDITDRSPAAARVSSAGRGARRRSEEHTSELQSRGHLVCRLLLEKKKRTFITRPAVTPPGHPAQDADERSTDVLASSRRSV